MIGNQLTLKFIFGLNFELAHSKIWNYRKKGEKKGGKKGEKKGEKKKIIIPLEFQSCLRSLRATCSLLPC